MLPSLFWIKTLLALSPALLHVLFVNCACHKQSRWGGTGAHVYSSTFATYSHWTGVLMKSRGTPFYFKNVIAVASYLAMEKYISQWKQTVTHITVSGGYIVDLTIFFIQKFQLVVRLIWQIFFLSNESQQPASSTSICRKHRVFH